MKLSNVTKRYGVKVVTASTAIFATSSFANGVPEAITAAVTAGESNYGLVVVGLITMAAIGFGLRMIIGAMK